MTTRRQLKRQMRAMLRTYRNSLIRIASYYDDAPLYIEEAHKSLNIAECALRDSLDFGMFITACNIAGDAIIRHANEIIEAAKERRVAS